MRFSVLWSKHAKNYPARFCFCAQTNFGMLCIFLGVWWRPKLAPPTGVTEPLMFSDWFGSASRRFRCMLFSTAGESVVLLGFLKKNKKLVRLRFDTFDARALRCAFVCQILPGSWLQTSCGRKRSQPESAQMATIYSPNLVVGFCLQKNRLEAMSPEHLVLDITASRLTGHSSSFHHSWERTKYGR